MPYLVTDACILCGACVVGCESNAIMRSRKVKRRRTSMSTCVSNAVPANATAHLKRSSLLKKVKRNQVRSLQKLQGTLTLIEACVSCQFMFPTLRDDIIFDEFGFQ